VWKFLLSLVCVFDGVNPNGRGFTDDVINYRIAFLTKNQAPPTGLKPHTDVLKESLYLARRMRNGSGA
jgi:hypothetical protein